LALKTRTLLKNPPGGEENVIFKKKRDSMKALTARSKAAPLLILNLQKKLKRYPAMTRRRHDLGTFIKLNVLMGEESRTVPNVFLAFPV
jgi:hypothetical protein